jgi:D-alanyl-D-alanine endopeptidase (penicillin-binding protein 7)
LNFLALVQWIVHRASTSRIWVRFLYAGPLLLASSLAMPAYAKKPVKVVESARAVLIYDRTRGTIKEEKNLHEAMPIASVTKLMTAYTVLESRADLNEKITVRTQKIERSPVLRDGMLLSRNELLHLSLISSDNLAAKTLALAHPEGYDAFIALMNNQAQRLGMTNTRYIEPTGLLPNTSTAWDLHILNSALIKYSIFNETAMSKTATQDAQSKKGLWQRLAIRNTNAFAGEYDIKVGKTGFTNPAGWCISMLIRHQGQEFDLIVLGSPSKKIRNELVALKLKDHMNWITANAVIKKIELTEFPEEEQPLIGLGL